MIPRRTGSAQAAFVATLIDNASDVIAVIDQDGAITFQSPSVERLLGYPPEELDGHSVFELVHPDDLPGAWTRMEQVLGEAGTTRASLIRMRHKDGSWRTFEAVGTAMFDDPLVGGIVVNARDVTDRLRLEHELAQAQKLEAVGRLAGGIAHDFNNLLTAIGGYAELLANSLDPEDRRRADAETIGGIVKRASQLTRRLLAFTRDRVIERQILDPHEVIRGLIRTLGPVLGENVELDVSIDAAPAWVKADPGQLEQLLLNLVLNARDAMPEGGTVTIATTLVLLVEGSAVQPEVPPGRYLRLSVSDTGTGIDDSVRANLFEPFFTTKKTGDGTGLGLAIVQRVVTESGGAIGVDSRPGEGSTFHIYLPAVEPDADRPRSEPEDEALGSDGGTETVLVVDDEATVRDIVERTLRACGYRVLSADDADTALELFRDGGPRIDLLLTDIVMPGTNGLDLVAQVRALRPATRTLFMTGYAQDATLLRDLDDRSAELIQKPFTPTALALRVREILDDPAPPPGAGNG